MPIKPMPKEGDWRVHSLSGERDEIIYERTAKGKTQLSDKYSLGRAIERAVEGTENPVKAVPVAEKPKEAPAKQKQDKLAKQNLKPGEQPELPELDDTDENAGIIINHGVELMRKRIQEILKYPMELSDIEYFLDTISQYEKKAGRFLKPALLKLRQALEPYYEQLKSKETQEEVDKLAEKIRSKMLGTGT